MSVKFLLDTNNLIGFLNNVPTAMQFFQSLKSNETAVSVITYAESLAGCDNQEEFLAVEQLIEKFICFSIDKSTAFLAAQLRRKYRFKLPDALQAAIALQHDLKLITRNIKDFDPKIHLFVKIPYSLSIV